MRDVQELDRSTLAFVIGGGADIGGILQAASPLIGMIPGIGPIASQLMPMIGQLASGAGGGQQQQAAAPQQAQAAAAATSASPSAGADPSQMAQSSPGPSRHHTSVSVSIG
jgi:hypothetical protein